MKMGIIQGRLSRPTEGFQETPSKWWDEFLMLPDLGLNHVEWIVTKDSFESNPIFNKEEDLKDFEEDLVGSSEVKSDKDQNKTKEEEEKNENI